MEEYADYEIMMQAFNDVGSSTASPKAIERTRESGKIIMIILFIVKNLICERNGIKSLFCIRFKDI